MLNVPHVMLGHGKRIHGHSKCPQGMLKVYLDKIQVAHDVVKVYIVSIVRLCPCPENFTMSWEINHALRNLSHVQIYFHHVLGDIYHVLRDLYHVQLTSTLHEGHLACHMIHVPCL
jgi:hypothetical protein